eukprot:Selendium_serpulae@DN4691_c0_g1_i2.p1
MEELVRSLTKPFTDQESAAKAEECPICFEPLCTSGVGGYLRRGKRSCAHFVHLECGKLLLTKPQKACPMCRMEFEVLAPMPDPLSQTQQWFQFIDVDGDGKLAKNEVVWALSALFNADPESIDKGIAEMWTRWDADGNGTVELSELTMGQFQQMPQLLNLIRGHRRPRIPIPHFRDGQHWFYYWDENRNGSLDFEEVYRAVCLTFTIKPFSEGKDSAMTSIELRSVLLAIWFEFDTNRSGEVDFEEFCQPGGLWDFIKANIAPVAFARVRSRGGRGCHTHR